MKEEICEECSGIIGLAEQAYVYEGRIVCEQCDKKLRQEDRQDQKSPDAEDTWLNQESEELLESLEDQEHKEILEFQEPQESKGPQEARAPEEFEKARESEELPAAEDTWKTQESEEIFELLQRQESEELEELKEPIAGPVEAEETADVPEVDSAKPLPRRRKRVRTTESKLLPILLAAWSVFALFLLFYMPGRYMSMMGINAFGYEDRTARFAVECLMLFLMVLWFFGALGLYVVIIGYDKDEKTNEKLRTLRLLGF